MWSDATSIWPMRSSCQYHRSQIWLNIHFTGIHVLGNLFSVTFYKTWDLYEISRQTLNFHLSMEPILVMPLHCEWGRRCWTTTALHLGSTSNTEHMYTLTLQAQWDPAGQLRKLRLLPPELWYTIMNQYLVIAARLWHLDHKTLSHWSCPELTCNKVKSYTTCGGYMG